METSTHHPPHIVVLPFAQQGHINPLMQLAKCLVARGATVTFVVSENTLPSGSSQTPNLQFVGVPDNLPAERAKGSSFKDSVDSMLNMEAGFRHLLQRLCSDQSSAGVSALIYDAFMSWAPSIASSLSVPCICFFTTNATTCSLAHQIPSLKQRGILPLRGDGDEDGPYLRTEIVQGIDGVPDLLPEDFPYDIALPADHYRHRFIVRIADVMRVDATAVVLNTMRELEPEAVAAVRAHKRVFTVGPLLLLSGRPSRLDVNYWPEEDHCLPWLDSHPPSSVLYVSFGSVASFPLPHFQQLALGLEASTHPFLWVVRSDSIDVPLELALPDGFLDRTKDRGLIISWGPQLLILSHPSVGGFFTHGGWNSILENLSMRSVPMICWPHVAEQRINRRLVVDGWNIGVRLQHEADGSVVAEDIACTIRELLDSKRGKDLKDSSSKFGRMARKAVESGGSSYNDFEAFYSYLTLLKDPKTCLKVD